MEGMGIHLLICFLGKRLLCGYADGAVKIWDLKAVSPVVSWSGQGRCSSVLGIPFCMHGWY